MSPVASDTLAGVLDHVTVTRYVTPLREGGSLPALVEADDLGTYVMKFRGAGQGPLALVAEIIAGELARRLGLRVPDLVLADLDPRIPGSEPDPEIQDLLKEVTALVPGEWFGDRGASAYTEHLLVRAPIVPDVIRG